MDLSIVGPHHYWLARRNDLPDLVDPDAQDKHQRHRDRDTIRWALIADAAQECADQLAGVSPGADGKATLSIQDRGLTEIESRILVDWFGHAPVETEPGISWPTNGRHRMWGCWQASPEAVLPICSGRLKALEQWHRANEGGANSDDHLDLDVDLRESALKTIREVTDGDAALDLTLPLNQLYWARLHAWIGTAPTFFGALTR